jgi:hypothetical protein
MDVVTLRRIKEDLARDMNENESAILPGRV